VIARKVLAEALGALLLTAGIRPVDVPGFMAAQVMGAFVGAQFLRLFAERKAVA
jgi:glycerol uptake facilitator-like aquaporin